MLTNDQINEFEREYLMIMILMLNIEMLTMIDSRSRGSSQLLYTEKKFGWTVTDYTNYQSFWTVHMSVKVKDE